MTKHLTILLIALLLASLAAAQEAAPLTGTITFRGGQTLSGVIQTADLGIMDGTGVGTGLTGYGAIRVNVGGQSQRVPATNIAVIEATWVDKSTPEEPAWEISELRITTADGKVLVGKPDWHMHATNVSVQLASGELKRVHAFPLGGSDFKPANLIAKIELGAPAAAAPTPAPAAPATTPAPAPAPAAPAPAPAPAPAAPAPTTPAPAAPTAPETTVAAAPTSPAPPAVTVVAPTVVTPGQPVVIKVLIPGTDKEVSILLYVSVTEKGIEVMPVTP